MEYYKIFDSLITKTFIIKQIFVWLSTSSGRSSYISYSEDYSHKCGIVYNKNYVIDESCKKIDNSSILEFYTGEIIITFGNNRIKMYCVHNLSEGINLHLKNSISMWIENSIDYSGDHINGRKHFKEYKNGIVYI